MKFEFFEGKDQVKLLIRTERDNMRKTVQIRGWSSNGWRTTHVPPLIAEGATPIDERAAKEILIEIEESRGRTVGRFQAFEKLYEKGE